MQRTWTKSLSVWTAVYEYVLTLQVRFPRKLTPSWNLVYRKIWGIVVRINTCVEWEGSRIRRRRS